MRSTCRRIRLVRPELYPISVRKLILTNQPSLGQAIMRWLACGLVILNVTIRVSADEPRPRVDHCRTLQQRAYEDGFADWAHWGSRPNRYSTWTDHSNRLIPVYTFGIGLEDFIGQNSVYRDAVRLEALYGYLPESTVNPDADYMDQTDVYYLQRRAVEICNKKYIFLIIFDGMDWQTTQAAAIVKTGDIPYTSGRGTGLHFQDYRGTTTDYGSMVTSPAYGSMEIDVDTQTVREPRGRVRGGYCAKRGGITPCCLPSSDTYLLCRDSTCRHLVTDSAASAVSMTCGIKSYNASINVAPDGTQMPPLAHWLQREHGFGIGVVTSVPISHATPACAYAHNVSRDDYQDITRDLLGLPSIAHPDQPLKGVDVLIGCGWGEVRQVADDQGQNFVPGNKYIADVDLVAIDQLNGGRYVVAQRTPGRPGVLVLQNGVAKACREKARLFGFFGQQGGHLAFRTADGGFDPLRSRYEEGDITESPRLAQMTRAAIEVLDCQFDKFWIMIEPGDVDWANHSNNLDDSIGAVLDGDDAFRAVTEWIEQRDAWQDAAVIVTADHGHYLVLTRPEELIAPKAAFPAESALDVSTASP